MYGNTSYGLLKYAQNAFSGDSLADEYFVDLTRYVPPFLREIREMAEVYRTQGYETGLLRYGLAELLDQCFVQSATWGLLRWEVSLGIDTNLSLSYEQRREIIMAKLRGQGTTTPHMIRDTAAAFSGGEVQVIEKNKSQHFIVKFVGVKGIPRNMQAFINMLEEIKPAHLSYSFEYTFTVWNSLAEFTWAGLSMKTWGEVKVMEEV